MLKFFGNSRQEAMAIMNHDGKGDLKKWEVFTI